MVMLLLALGLLGAPAYAAPPSPWTPEPAPLGWGATAAEWRLVIREGEPVRMEARYTLASVDPKAATLALAGPELLVTDVSGPVYAAPEGLVLALGPERRRVDQRFVGLYSPPSPGSLSLPVLTAARTHVVVDAPGFDVTVAGAVDGWLPPTDRLDVTWSPHVDGEKPYEALVTQGESAATFRGDAGGLTVDAVVRWRVVRGEARRLTFAANGLEELEVAGDAVASWRREGDTVLVEPKSPVKGLFTVTVKGRAPLGKAQRSVPVPEPTNVLRVDRFVTMARSDEGELIPVAMPASVPLAKLPAWAKNLGDGVPLVAWHGPQPVQVLPGAFEAVQGPDTVITQARYTYAAAADGHAALRMNLRVRNERRQFLHLRPGAGWTPVVIRVGNQPVSWLSDGEGGIYVPLEKSVETVKGLLSFPVDVEWLGTDAPVWERRGEMKLTLPSVDAPVQAASWEVHLPRGFRALRAADAGTGRMLLGDLRDKAVEDESGSAAAERERQEVVSSALQNAVSAYKQNDWSTAQRWLDEAKNVDAGNEDAQSLQANLDVLEGRAQSNDLGSRRVRDLAKAKTSGLQKTQSTVEKEAEYALRAGDLDAAEEKYAAAVELANELQKTEQLESAEQSTRLEEAQKKLAEIQVQRQQKVAFEEANAPAQAVADGDGELRLGWSDDDAPPPDVELPPEPEPEVAPDEGQDDVAQALGEAEGFAGMVATGDGDATGEGASGVLDGVEGVEGGVYGGVVGGELAGAPGAVATEVGGLGMKGEGPGGGGVATGSSTTLGSLGTRGSGSGQGYGSGNGRAAATTKKVEVTMEDDAEEVTVTATRAGKAKAAPPKPAASARAHGGPAPTPSTPTTAYAPPMEAPAPPMAEPVAAAPPPPPPPPPAPVTVSKDELARIPSGRSYQSTVSAAPGVVAGKNASRKERKKEQAPAMKPAKMDEAMPAADDLAYEPLEADAPELDARPQPPEPGDVFADEGEAGGEGLDANLDRAPATGAEPDPALASRPRRAPERRAPLVATPSPMALAMPLDGPTLTTNQALQPAGAFPTFSFKYKALPSENR